MIYVLYITYFLAVSLFGDCKCSKNVLNNTVFANSHCFHVKFGCLCIILLLVRFRIYKTLDLQI